MPKKPATKPAKTAATRTRKPRIDSVAAQLAVAAAAQKKIEPPAIIRMQDDDVVYFDAIVDQYARSEWADHDLHIAALLACALRRIENEQFALDTEGCVITLPSGTKIVNPRNTIVQSLAGTIMSYRRTLSLHARAYAGDSRDVAKRQAISKRIEKGVNDHDDDGLIAKPQPTMH